MASNADEGRHPGLVRVRSNGFDGLVAGIGADNARHQAQNGASHAIASTSLRAACLRLTAVTTRARVALFPPLQRFHEEHRCLINLIWQKKLSIQMLVTRGVNLLASFLKPSGRPLAAIMGSPQMDCRDRTAAGLLRGAPWDRRCSARSNGLASCDRPMQRYNSRRWTPRGVTPTFRSCNCKDRHSQSRWKCTKR